MLFYSFWRLCFLKQQMSNDQTTKVQAVYTVRVRYAITHEQISHTEYLNDAQLLDGRSFKA